MNDLRQLPSVYKVLKNPDLLHLINKYGVKLVTSATRQVLATLRETLKSGDKVEAHGPLVQQIEIKLRDVTQPSLVSVINATGVILHTNLGRAPLSRAAMNALGEVAGGYSTLEFNLDEGTRGERSIHARRLITAITGAEDALVVNNNAAAVLLCLAAIANRRKVVISRSQLVEIGGGFRIPEVMKNSGARLMEVGTTNRVNLVDYEDAIKDGAALVMRAHSSNFKLVGFTAEPNLGDIIALAHHHGIPFLDDLGSGALLDTSVYGLAHEPMVQESIQAGADLVCFSGDKLLGGPQAGIICGRRELIDKMKRHPFARAVRADKLCLAALSATLLHYLTGEVERMIPVWRMISASGESLQVRAENWLNQIGEGEVIGGFSTVGGGSLPEETLPTTLYAVKVRSIKRFLEALRTCHPAIVGRVEDDKAVFDPRTVSPDEDPIIIEEISQELARRRK